MSNLRVPWNKGKKWSPEVLEKMRKPHPSMLGDNNPSKRSDVREKISDSLKERWQDPVYREFMQEMEKRPDVKEKKVHVGEDNFFWGKKIDPEIVRKGVETRKKNGSYIAWNKGKTGIYSPETIELISRKNKEKWQDPEYRKRCTANRPDQSGSNNPFFGKKHSDKTKQIISENNSGEKNYNWKGGISKEPYCFEFTKGLKEQIKERDDYQCQNPDCWKTNNKLVVHHIDYNKKNCSADNLITLCRSCNSRVNDNRNYWKNIFSQYPTGI